MPTGGVYASNLYFASPRPLRLCVISFARRGTEDAEVKNKGDVGSAHSHICHPELVLAVPAFCSRGTFILFGSGFDARWTLKQVQGDVGR
jgi:hypothetical protein